MAFTSLFKNTVAKLVIYDKRDLGEQTFAGLDTDGVDDLDSVLTGGTTGATFIGNQLNYDVHFNPSQIQIQVAAEQELMTDLASSNSNVLRAESQKPVIPTVIFTTKLIFDHVVNADAFISDTLTPSIMGVAETAATLTGNTSTVRDEVEALLGVMYFPTTREVQFIWESFSFTGQLTYMNAQYTMFNSAGDPIRAEIMMRLTQHTGKDVLNAWQAQFELAFGSVTDLTTAADAVSSVLNISI
ncbi:MAG: hypothetical protein R3Y62_05205 [Eubacteriales bacterium]